MVRLSISTILENNAAQSIATAAGYMTGPLISGMAAYMWIQNTIIPWWQMAAFNVVLSLLGVLVAFPMKRRFINDEQLPFPEGQACGVVLDTLYHGDGATGMKQARALVTAGLAAIDYRLTDAIADPPVFGRARAVARYDGAARDLVHRLKYGDGLDLAPALARWLASGR